SCLGRRIVGVFVQPDGLSRCARRKHELSALVGHYEQIADLQPMACEGNRLRRYRVIGIVEGLAIRNQLGADAGLDLLIKSRGRLNLEKQNDLPFGAHGERGCSARTGGPSTSAAS